MKQPVKGLDWSESSSRYGVPMACYLLFYVLYYVRVDAPGKSEGSLLVLIQLLQNELYWLISTVAREPKELVRLSSFLRALESAGEFFDSRTFGRALIISSPRVRLRLWGFLAQDLEQESPAWDQLCALGDFGSHGMAYRQTGRYKHRLRIRVGQSGRRPPCEAGEGLKKWWKNRRT